MDQPKYWTGIEELEKSSKIQTSEFSSELPMEQRLSETTEETLGLSSNRRDFLKLFGFGMTAATLAACNETPLKKVIPFVVKPDDMNPGVANWYSSVCGGCSAACGVQVKTREGRPIKLEGNPEDQMTKGGLCAVGHATVLNLYDIDRLQKPLVGNKESDWTSLDTAVRKKIDDIKARGAGAKVRVLSSTITSPSTLSAINDFFTYVGGGSHVTYDAVSYSAISQANAASFGKKAIPSYAFDKADVIVSFAADFLGTWLSPVQFSAQYVTNRNPKLKKMSRHFQVESLMSLTGSNADVRYPVNPSELGLALANLYNKVATATGNPSLSGVSAFNLAGNSLDLMANELVAAKGRSLVVCGENDVNLQTLVNGINAMLGNYGTTLDLDNPSFQKQGDDAALAQLIKDLESGQVEALFVYNANPVYDTAYGEKLKTILPKLGLSVAFANKADETSSLCQFNATGSHEMESWNDASPKFGSFAINQPTINPIFSTRQPQDSFLKWSGNPATYYDYIRGYWEKNILGGASWDDTLRKGLFYTVANAVSTPSFDATKAAAAVSAIKPAAQGLEVVLYEKISIGDGSNLNNPWLREMPDPVSRVSWDHYVTVPVAYAKEKGLKQDDVIEVKVGNLSVKLPVVPQPGQAKNTLGIALGYGRDKIAGKTAALVSGENAFKLLKTGDVLGYTQTCTVNNTGETFEVAKFQKAAGDRMTDANLKEKFGNDFDRTDRIVKETTLENYIKNPLAGNESREHIRKNLITLWDSHYKDEETQRFVRWVMAIDLNKCTGCGACVVSCQAENNVPVVGKQEIITHRDMHWMRIDRYYSGSDENPSVIFQPLMCQHCANAPCETVCPVLATVHSHEGLNQMVYNRCVGTRYCANNCPYKVRRFNWFKYHNNDNFDFHMNNSLGKLVLNPDVTVRFRGVMEKCSFCMQRLQEGKLKAKINAQSSLEKPEDGSIKTACQQSCPTGAIVFGDLNDAKSEVSKLFRDERSFHVLEEIKTLPAVSYQTKVRNRHAGEMANKAAESHAAEHSHS